MPGSITRLRAEWWMEPQILHSWVFQRTRRTKVAVFEREMVSDHHVGGGTRPIDGSMNPVISVRRVESKLLSPYYTRTDRLIDFQTVPCAPTENAQ